MLYRVHINAYTLLGDISASIRLSEEQPGETTEELLQLATQFPDDGETDPREFLRGVLVGILESI